MTTATSTAPALWPDCLIEQGLSNLITPNALAQSAIFSTQVFRGPMIRPRFLERKQLASLSHMAVFQLSGEQLDQGDADVFFELLRRVIANGDGSSREARVCFNRVELLHALGRKKGGNSVRLLTDSLERLTDATFFFQIPGLLTGRSRLILKSLTRIDVPTMETDYDVLIDVELSKLFSNEQWSFLRKSERLSLSHDPLAKGMHAYFSTFQDPYPIKVTTLQSLMGRESTQSSKFIETLKASLRKLKEVTGWKTCEIAESGPNIGKVVVEKKMKAPSAKNQTAEKAVPLPKKAGLTWDSIFSNRDLAGCSLQELESLMDGQAKQEWDKTLVGFNTDDKDIHCRAARNILERQWQAIQESRVLSDDDI